MTRRIVFACLIFLGLGASARAELSITFEPPHIVVDGVTPGGEIVWLGVFKDQRGGVERISQDRGIATDDDRDGQISLGELLPADVITGIAVALDTSSGEWASADPRGERATPRPLAIDRLRPGTNGFSELTWGWQEIWGVWLRRGSGAWWIHAVDGSSEDADGLNDNFLTMPFDRARPVREGGGPRSVFHGDDLLLLIDTDELRLWSWTAEGGRGGGGQ